MQNSITIDLQRLGKIVEDAGSEVYLFSPANFRFLYVNRGGCENLGYSLEQLRELTPLDIKPEFDRTRFEEMVQPLINGKLPYLDFRTVHERRDGSQYDASIRLQLMDDGKEALFYAAVQDITELKQTQKALHETTMRLEAILGNTAMAVFLMDERQHCIFMNDAAEKLTGFAFAETQGRPLHDVIHHSYPDGRHFPIDECAIDRAFPENHQTVGEEIFVHKDGSFYPVGFTASPMKDGNGTTYGTIIEAKNITSEIEARKKIEDFNATLKSRIEEALKERRNLENQLIQAQKMEAIGQLTGGVAHDFNNLLQVIGGNLQLLHKDLAGDGNKLQRVQNALAGVDRGAKLASQLLAFGRQQPLDPKPVHLGRLVRGMDDMLRRTLGESIEIETVVAGGLWNCMVDHAQVENLLLNLAINARDAMDRHGKLTIEAGNAFLDEAYANNYQDVAPGQYVMLAVTDTGCGMTADILEKVFEPFYTTKGPGEGTGLGLSMVYGFVKQSQGHIKIYSERGEGTTIRIYLPRTFGAEELFETKLTLTPHASGSETILVVEDDDAVRITTVDLLTDLGYVVLEANSADNALVIVNSGAKIDLLFTDVVMPGKLKSPELARIAQLKIPTVHVLFTSGYTQNAIVHAGRLDEGVELIAKPFTREGLAQKIRAILASNVHNLPTLENVDFAKNEDQEKQTSQYLSILLVEDEVLIRMSLCEMLQDQGHTVFQAATLGEAREHLSKQQLDVLISDIGLPDGSGLDLVKEVDEHYPSIYIVIASGNSVRIELDKTGSQKAVRHLLKPFDETSLRALLSDLRRGD
jgi:PAS domain S-box-containing protein